MRRQSLAAIKLSNHSINIMLDLLDQSGLDRDVVLAASGISERLVSDPQAEISGQQELAFQSAFVDATKHLPGFWVRTGLQYRLMAYGPFGLAVLVAPTVASALKLMDSFQDLTFSLMNYQARFIDGELTCLDADDSFIPAELRQFSIERSLGSVYRFLTDMWQRPARLQRVECALPRPAAWDQYAHLIPHTVIFDRPVTRWVFEKGAGNDHLPMANPLLERTYEHQCAAIIQNAQVKDDVAGRLVQLLVENQRGFPTAKEASAALAVSERTLHRRLESEKLSYGQVLDQVRGQRARMLLDGSQLPISHIAEMVGFAEISSFSRAFKRWTGLSPLRYRSRER